MQAYVEALKVIFPDRAVQAALLYTSGPSLIALTG
jgi:ATP-dependent helicase/nuclease subunit A